MQCRIIFNEKSNKKIKQKHFNFLLNVKKRLIKSFLLLMALFFCHPLAAKSLGTIKAPIIKEKKLLKSGLSFNPTGGIVFNVTSQLSFSVGLRFLNQSFAVSSKGTKHKGFYVGFTLNF